MGFIQGFGDFSEGIPTRAYLHSAGIEAYGGNSKEQFASARNYLGHAKNSVEFQEIKEQMGLEYTLAAIWAHGETRVIDFFGFGDVVNKWPGNPDVTSWDFRNGVFTRGALTCGDTLIMLGKEELYRRTTEDLQTYFESPFLLDN